MDQMKTAIEDLAKELGIRVGGNRLNASQTDGAWLSGYHIGKADAYTFVTKRLREIMKPYTEEAQNEIASGSIQKRFRKSVVEACYTLKWLLKWLKEPAYGVKMETRFVQIGRDAFNVASINHVNFSTREQSVSIDYGPSGKVIYLRGPAAWAFHKWWECANVYYLDAEKYP